MQPPTSAGAGCTGTLPNGKRVGVCSGGAGEFAVDAKNLGCDLYVTGEASWGDVIAAENVGMPMVCAGHYQTETFGVKALAKAIAFDSRSFAFEVNANYVFVGIRRAGKSFLMYQQTWLRRRQARLRMTRWHRHLRKP